MRSDAYRTVSAHYFHAYAVEDRVDFSNLSEEQPFSRTLDNKDLASMMVPTAEDDQVLFKHFKILIGRILVENIEFFKATFDNVVTRHIKHSYSKEMSQRSNVVREIFSVYTA